MATNQEGQKRIKVNKANIVRDLMEKPGVVPTRIEELPSDVADVVRAVDERPAKRAVRRKFSAESVGGNSVILAHFDALRKEGNPFAIDLAVGTFYKEFVQPAQADWKAEELHAYQQGSERTTQRKTEEKQATLRRYDALIERLKD